MAPREASSGGHPSAAKSLVLHDANRPARRRTLFWRARRGERTWRAVRDGGLKYISRTDAKGTRTYLFDLDRDPAEKANLLATRDDDAQRLQRLLAAWEERVRPAR